MRNFTLLTLLLFFAIGATKANPDNPPKANKEPDFEVKAYYYPDSRLQRFQGKFACGDFYTRIKKHRKIRVPERHNKHTYHAPDNSRYNGFFTHNVMRKYGNYGSLHYAHYKGNNHSLRIKNQIAQKRAYSARHGGG